MMDKQQYQRTFGVLHASGDFLREAQTMKQTRHFSPRRAICLCAAVVLLLGLAQVCYAADVGGIQRIIQIWIRGEQTNAVMDIRSGQYHVEYRDADGETHERCGGGVAIEPNGQERPVTEAEMMEYLNMPEVEYLQDGTVWVYYHDQAMEITDKFEDGVCFVQLKDGEDVRYLTVEYQNGYSCSPNAFIQPNGR